MKNKRKKSADASFNFTFRLTNLKLEAHTLNFASQDLVEKLNEKSVLFGVQCFPEYVSISSSLKYTVIVQIGIEQTLLSAFQIAVVFELINPDYLVINDNGSTTIPDPVLLQLAGISLSTSRGIVYSKLMGTYLEQYIMPVVDPHTILEQTLKNIENTQ